MLLNLRSIRIDGGTQSRVELNNATVEEYSEAMAEGAAFPPVVVFFDGANHWLADGFHRYFGADHAGIDSIAADVRNGTQQDAQLFSFSVNADHGLRRSNADKRKSVTGALKHPVSSKWSDNQIAKHCGVHHSTVGDVRRSLADSASDKPAERTYTTKHGTSAVMNTANIGVQQHREAAKACHEADIARGGHGSAHAPAPAPKAAPEAPPAPANHELEEAVSTINELAAENDQLRDRVAVAAMSGTDEERAMAAETIAELRDQIKTLEAELDAVRTSRDSFQRQNAELMKQVRLQQKQIKKLGG